MLITFSSCNTNPPEDIGAVSYTHLVFVTGENTKATAITNFTDAEAGVVYTIYGSGSEYASTIAAGGNFVLTEAMTLSEGKFIKLAKAADGKFYEVARG